MTDRPHKHLGGEALRKKSRWADNQVALQLARLRAHDPEFTAALDLAMELDDEIAARRNA